MIRMAFCLNTKCTILQTHCILPLKNKMTFVCSGWHFPRSSTRRSSGLRQRMAATSAFSSGCDNAWLRQRMAIQKRTPPMAPDATQLLPCAGPCPEAGCTVTLPPAPDAQQHFAWSVSSPGARCTATFAPAPDAQQHVPWWHPAHPAPDAQHHILRRQMHSNLTCSRSPPPAPDAVPKAQTEP